MPLRQISGECFTLFCAVMLGLAAGALWLIPTVYMRHPLPWLALPIAGVLALAVRPWARGRRWHAALLGLLSTATALVYVRMLIAAVQLAAITGNGLLEVAHRAGGSMLFDLARIGANHADLIWGALALATAAFIAARPAPG